MVPRLPGILAETMKIRLQNDEAPAPTAQSEGASQNDKLPA